MDKDKLAVAIWVATYFHRGQFDKSGEIYIRHPLRVMESLREQGEAAMIVGVLHDVLEDTDCLYSELISEFGKEIALAVVSVTRMKDETYRDFIFRAKLNPIGRLVKIADINDNLQPWRNVPGLESLHKKYELALKILQAE